jgi:tetratricopeptide (TPR) repeat protein
MEEKDSGMYYYGLSMQESEGITYNYLNATTEYRLGGFLIKEGRWLNAIDHYNSALQKFVTIYETGSFYSDPGKRYESDWLLDYWDDIFKVFSIKARQKWVMYHLVRVNLKISDIYKHTGNPVKALEYYEAYHAWSDTMNRIQRARELLNLEMDSETEIKDRKIENLTQGMQLQQLEIRQSRLMLMGIGGLVVLGTIIVILLFRQNRMKSEQDKVMLQQKLFRSQINPHFIFNSLSSIQHLVVSDEPEQASIYLAEFSTLVRSVLYSTMSEHITYENEIKIIHSYLELQKLRYEGKFEYAIEVDPDMDTESLTIPSMLAQPFIENAIEHGFRHKEGTGHLKIGLKLDGDKVCFEIEDDGIGRQKARDILHQQNKDHQSLSTSIIRERIRVLNRGKKDKITLEIEDLKDEEGEGIGTRVVFRIPV